MKKRTTKIAAALFAATLAVTGVAAIAPVDALTVSAAATSGSIVIKNATAGHKYSAYQIFKGTVDDEGKLTGIEWADTITDPTVKQAIVNDIKNEFKIATLSTTAGDVAEAISDIESNSTNAEKLAKIFEKNLGADTYQTSTVNALSNYLDNSDQTTKQGYVFNNLSAGYYFVKDTTDNLTSDAYTRVIVQVVGNTQIAPKVTTPEVKKKVADKGTAAGAIESADTVGGITWHDAETYEIGNDISYKLEATLPSDYRNYDEYYLQFVDTLSKGLTADVDPANVKVYKLADKDGDGEYTDYTLISTGYTVSELSSGAESTEGSKYTDTSTTKFTVTFNNLKAKKGNDSTGMTFNDGDKIVVAYKAKLNDNAVIGTANGNPNKVVLNYSNNPYADGSGKHGTTPKDEVSVYTFKVDIDKKKYGINNEALPGAVFKISEGNSILGYGISAADGTVKFYSDATYTPATGEEAAKVEGGTKEVTLKAGTYTINELYAPKGYEVVQEFTIKVAPTIVGYAKDDDNPQLTALDVTVVTKGSSDDVTVPADEVISPADNAANATIKVVDQNKSNLPSTGDSGRMLYYAFGGMVAIAALLYLLREKKNA